MISLSSTAQFVRTLRGAKDVSLTAYTLSRGAVLDGLLAAARRGAHVRVRLEGDVYKDAGGAAAANAHTIARLCRAGADAALVDEDPATPVLHLKAALVDGRLFLNDRNWPTAGDTIVRDTSPCDVRRVSELMQGKTPRAVGDLALRKRDALASEARLVDTARCGDDVVVETESFGSANAVCRAIDAAARRGARVRLLINARDCRQAASARHVLARLARDGVEIRTSGADEKFAVVRTRRAWIGSANATAAFDRPDQLDWGLQTSGSAVVTHLSGTFGARWATGERACSRSRP